MFLWISTADEMTIPLLDQVWIRRGLKATGLQGWWNPARTTTTPVVSYRPLLRQLRSGVRDF
jgi:hypothetical protein